MQEMHKITILILIIYHNIFSKRFRNKDVHRALFRAYYVLKRLDDHGMMNYKFVLNYFITKS